MNPSPDRDGSLVRSVVRVVRQTVSQRRIPSYVVEYVRQRPLQTWRPARERLACALDAVRLVVQRPMLWIAPQSAARAAQVDRAARTSADFKFVAVREVADDNLAIVADLLRAAGVPFFVRDADAAGPVVVGVDVAHRARVWSGLAAASRGSSLYVGTTDGRRAVEASRIASRRGARVRGERVVVYRTHRLSESYVIGPLHGCVIELWHRAGANLRPPAGALPGRLVPSATASATVTVAGREYPTLSDFAGHRSLAVPTTPVDVVYTWVDDSDPCWRRALEHALAREERRLHPWAVNAARYHNSDELRYSLRSLGLYAPFVRRIFVVTAGHVPAWLDVDHPDIQIVDHTELLDGACLPTFNSHAIEARLHHIDGLAEHYLYFNDDFMLGREVTAGTFFIANGLAKLFPDVLAPILAGPATPDDLPVDAASKNVRDLLHAHCDVHVARKILHVPYPQRRSVLMELEQRFPDEFERTTASRFRHPTDLNVASCLAHYYAFATGRAVPDEIAAEYINIASRWAGPQMGRLLERRDVDAFCVNETDVPLNRAAAVRAAAARFLQSYLPVPSPWELRSAGAVRKNVTMSVKPYTAAEDTVIDASSTPGSSRWGAAAHPPPPARRRAPGAARRGPDVDRRDGGRPD
jgi:Stealth protein CR2, conserved region 2/Stealth protein CR3, conserved region 3/Stealth protein CR1, conserved region 1/Stealth protein CR4, conserved region 4